MSNANKLGPKPQDPAKISFANDCFEESGTKVEYVVSNGNGNAYPRTFATREQAEANRHGTQIITERTTPVRVRIKWA
jgi:hypothetical protein